jgi:large subunit ribosomal protein L36
MASTSHLSGNGGHLTLLLRTLINKEDAMKVRASIKSLKEQPGAQVVRRRGKVFVINKLNPRYKGRQG